ncbi:restriction endonuclease subunit S [Carnobacterium divergens]|uniref:restriction endonuclease subunit S n=1 Tax=Carnobacterium divergens TaxID=2748 RepID=UPI00128C974C|nr:restriction endonuclease subunit S [Carnobacterium divergens]
MKLKKLVELNVGQNVSRMKDQEDLASMMYTNSDLLNDLHENQAIMPVSSKIQRSEKHSIVAGDVLYSFISSTAGIASQASEGKRFNQNFARLTITSEELDPKYLCYVLNESSKVTKQMAILMQGSVVPKMTPAILRELNIQFPTLKKQSLIGDSYFNLNRQHYLAKLELALQKKVYLELLKKLDQ